MDDNKILKDKRKQSSITTAAMSICVSPDALDSMIDLLSRYNDFLKNKNHDNYLALMCSMREFMLQAKILRSQEEIREMQQSVSQKNGTIDDIIHSFFPIIERLEDK